MRISVESRLGAGNTDLIEQLDPASLDNINTPDDLASSVLEKAI